MIPRPLVDTALEDYVAESTLGQASGPAQLGGDGKLPTAQLPAAVLGGVNYQGVWNASTNTPNIGASGPTKGHYYVVSVSGATSLGGITDWVVNDIAIYNGAAWEKIDNTCLVTSVNGQTGAVSLPTYYPTVGSVVYEPVAPSTSKCAYWRNAWTANGNVYGIGTANQSASGTFSVVVDAATPYRKWSRYTGAASIGTVVGWQSTAFNHQRRDCADWVVFHFRADAAVTNRRLWAGWTNATLTNAQGDAGPAHHAAFTYSTARGDTSIQFSTRDGTTQNLTATGMAFVAGHEYIAVVQAEPGTGVIRWGIKDVTAGTTATGTTNTNLPGASTWLFWGVVSIALAAEAQAFDVAVVQGGELLPS